MKHKKLEWMLQQLDGFENPNVRLEQYQTSAEIATSILQSIDADISLSNKSVADLGCGCGTFAIGAALMDANFCVGFDIDQTVLHISSENAQQLELSSTDWVQCDVRILPKQTRWHSVFDVAILNPPFGTKKNEGMDIAFVESALWLAPVVYSLHKSSTRQYVLRKAKSMGAAADVRAQLRFDLPASYKFHRKQSVDIEIDFIKFDRNAKATNK